MADSQVALTENLDTYIRPRLSPEQRQRVRTMRVTTTMVAEGNPLNFWATPSRGVVVAPASSLRLFGDLLYAWAWLAENEKSPDTVLEYLAMLKYQWLLGRRSLSAELRPHRVLGIPEGVRENKLLAERVDWQFNSAMFYVLCHEVGHIVLGHQGSLPPTESQAQETEADAFAFNIMRGVGQPVDGVLFYFLFLAVLEPNAIDGAVPGTGTHPLSAARIRAMNRYLQENAHGFGRVQADPNAAADYFRRWSLLADQAIDLLDDRRTQVSWRDKGERATPFDLKPRTFGRSR